MCIVRMYNAIIVMELPIYAYDYALIKLNACNKW